MFLSLSIFCPGYGIKLDEAPVLSVWWVWSTFYSQVHLDSEWLYLLGSHLWVKQIAFEIIGIRLEYLKPYKKITNYWENNKFVLLEQE